MKLIHVLINLLSVIDIAMIMTRDLNQNWYFNFWLSAILPEGKKDKNIIYANSIFGRLGLPCLPAGRRLRSSVPIRKENKATGAIADADISIYSEPTELIFSLISIFGSMKLVLSLSVLVLRGRDLFCFFYFYSPTKHSKFLFLIFFIKRTLSVETNRPKRESLMSQSKSAMCSAW